MDMYEVMIKSGFSAAHSLREYGGKCEGLHGHNFRVDVYVKAKKLDDIGLAIDFRILKEKTKVVIDQLDHKYLNDSPYFSEINPSSENIAVYIFKNLEKEVNDGNIVISRVAVWESENSCASYYEGE
ncbi:MAG: 6-carboxytetrahydropterin synthase QueD [Pseudomonadota bacterium]